MKTYEEMEYHPTSEKLVEVLCSKTQINNPNFFRVLVAFYMCQVASMMRASVVSYDGRAVPVNMYALNLSTSGSGKGKSTNLIESHVTNLFRARFLEETFPLLAEKSLPKLAVKRANRKASDPNEELERVEKEFKSLGPLVFSFDSATVPAVKQLRHKLLMAEAGSLNLQIDEIGSNLVGNVEVLNTFLELYDVGVIKQKLVKNTNDSTRSEEIVGNTPTNMLLFGTPAKLLNGGKTEEELYSMLETGYARRCFFGYGKTHNTLADMTPEQILALANQQGDMQFLDQLADDLEALADIINVNRKMALSHDAAILLIQYQQKCVHEAEEFPEHEEMKKAELSHRYFKALKLAGAYAFIDNDTEVTVDHLYYAIKLAEDSGESFNKLLTRDRPYVKLAKYIANVRREVTQADLVEDLPFYRGPAGSKQEMMTLAIAYGYKNNIIIKKSFSDGIEFFRGETLEETNLDKLKISWSTQLADGYKNEYAPFDKLDVLTQAEGLHWINHHSTNGHRSEENMINGFNLIVLDVDEGATLSMVQSLMSKYKFLIYTTKRHTEDSHRFRLILPTNFTLKMDTKEYKEFMDNIYEWLPFGVDTTTGQRARKWLSNPGQFITNDGELFDVLPFIPKTSKNEERKLKLNDQQAMDALERWMLNNSGDGNRNNIIHRYARILLDAGLDMSGIQEKVFALNSKMPDKLDDIELMQTVMSTVSKQLAAKV